ncbi:hypothetical protein C8D87_11486 [Lentzea atacamensis]|uniref:Uncharacterized protein n=1 Tax=Lentzea atacamensis TaxID=531938 RepID=A0ABX9DW12_9PSEU|nr:hypothetical protein [Lentzea atacamensis]RAS59474.1 hypothetical protein C8D87_11486 [Lentzea atacamensis]
MRKRRNTIVSLAERRAAARTKHDARASYQRRWANLDRLRHGQTEPTTTTTNGIDLATLVEGAVGAVSGFEDQWVWCEEEIQKACARHRSEADRIWHVGVSLFYPTHKRMNLELVYRAHCRELLDRVVAGEDTRPGTAAEVICLLHNTSLISPLTSAATGLYMRMYQAAGLPEIPEFAEMLVNYEKIERFRIDDHEAEARAKLARPSRVVPTDITCSGQHHGETVDCVYMPSQLALIG